MDKKLDDIFSSISGRLCALEAQVPELINSINEAKTTSVPLIDQGEISPDPMEPSTDTVLYERVATVEKTQTVIIERMNQLIEYTNTLNLHITALNAKYESLTKKEEAGEAFTIQGPPASVTLQPNFMDTPIDLSSIKDVERGLIHHGVRRPRTVLELVLLALETRYIVNNLVLQYDNITRRNI